MKEIRLTPRKLLVLILSAMLLSALGYYAYTKITFSQKELAQFVYPGASEVRHQDMPMSQAEMMSYKVHQLYPGRDIINFLEGVLKANGYNKTNMNEAPAMMGSGFDSWQTIGIA